MACKGRVKNKAWYLCESSDSHEMSNLIWQQNEENLHKFVAYENSESGIFLGLI